MISAKVAFGLVVNKSIMPPIKSLDELDIFIRSAAYCGCESLEVFLPKDKEVLFKKKLRDSGFLVDSLYFKSLPNEVLVIIHWVRAEFIGETEKEINDE